MADLLPPEPFNKDLEFFLTGLDECKLDIDPLFAKPFLRVLEEFRRDAPDEIVLDAHDPDVSSIFVPGLVFRSVPAGILLFDDERPIGGYLSCDLSLLEEYQGQGLGTELVVERCLRDGCSPIWALDSAAYSPAGLAAHKAAWRHVRGTPGETLLRMKRLS